MTLSTLSSNLDANHELVNDANPVEQTLTNKLVNDAKLLDSNHVNKNERMKQKKFREIN